MKRILSVTASLLVIFTMRAGQYTKFVNPFIGTGAVENSLSGNC